MAEIKDKLVIAESLKNVYDTLNNNINQVSDKMDNLPQPDWNQNDSTAADYVKNRPFYEETKTLFEWDGNTEGLDAVDFDGANVYRVPNIEYVSSDNFIGALAVVSEGSEIVITDEDINTGSNGCFFVGSIIYIPYDNFNYEGIITFPKAGAYHIDTEVSGGTYFKSIKNTVIKKIDEKYMPDGFVKSVNKRNPDATGNIDISSVLIVKETSSGVVDKTNYDISQAISNGIPVILMDKGLSVFYLYSYCKTTSGGVTYPFYFSHCELGSTNVINIKKATVESGKVKYVSDSKTNLLKDVLEKPSGVSEGQALFVGTINKYGKPDRLTANYIPGMITFLINKNENDEYYIDALTETLGDIYNNPKKYIGIIKEKLSSDSSEYNNVRLPYIFSNYLAMDEDADYVTYVGQSERKRYIVKIYKADSNTGEYPYTVDITDLATEDHINELINAALNGIGVAEEGVY